jgi:hypothetical protein
MASTLVIVNSASRLGAWPKGQAELCALLGTESLE